MKSIIWKYKLVIGGNYNGLQMFLYFKSLILLVISHLMSVSVRIVYGYKDLFSKITFLFTGLVLLIWFNIGIFIILIRYPQWKRYFFVGLAIFGWIFWRMWRIQKKLYYIFDKGNITIVLPWRKKFLLSKKNIRKTEKIDHLSWWNWWWISYIPWKKEFHFTTSTHHLLKIYMDDGRVIVISPKKYL